MKTIKWLLFGIACMLLGLCMLLWTVTGGSGLGLFLPMVGAIICGLAMTMKD